MTGYSCRTCDSTNCTWLGKLPDARIFAGRTLDEVLPGGGLWRCSNCGFAFRAPLLDEETYQLLYREGGLEVWDVLDGREDFRLIRKMLGPFDGQNLKVLDFGCYTGQLLDSLSPSFKKFGVEPNLQAAEIASARGIQMVAPDGAADKYDVILCCDVIEHVANPLEHMTMLRAQLKEGGQLIMSTGNVEAFLWRVAGSRFWYCQFPEHISFLGPRWIRRMQHRAGLEIQSLTRFNYRGGSLDLGRILAALLYRINPPIYGMLSRVFRGSKESLIVPGSGATMDHMLCRFRAV